MKKIIGGKVYDSDTARYVGSWDNGNFPNDLYYCAEELYCKKTGEYFLIGAGGAASKYSVGIGNNNWSGDTQIIPLTYDAAKEWAEKGLDADDYIAEFGEIAEDDTKRVVTINITTSLYESVKRTASERGTTISALIEDALRKYLV